MRVVSNKTLAYWKEAAVTLRQLIAEGHASRDHFRELLSALRHAKRRIRQIEGKILVCALLLILAGGCNAVNGVCKDGAWLLEQAAKNTEVQDK